MHGSRQGARQGQGCPFLSAMAVQGDAVEPMQPAEQLQGTSHQSPEGLQGSQLHGAASWRGSTGALEAMSASSAAQQQGGESTAASSSRDGAASSPGQRRGSTGHMHMQASNLAMHEGASLAPSISAPSLQSLTSQPTQQPWKVKRPIVDGCPKQKRRDLRKLNRTWTLEEVAQHKYVDDIWIAVDGRVYDITEHLVNHEGWETAGVTTPLSILAHAGQECSQEFHAIHRVYPIAYKQLKAFYIGDLLETGEWQSKDTPPGPEPGRLHSGR